MRKKHDDTYSRLLGSKKWKKIRAEHLSKHPLCQMCEAQGRTRLCEEVHHIIPISTATSAAYKRKLAYDPNNLMSLCAECHKSVHASDNPYRGVTRAENKANAKNSALMFYASWIGGRGL